MTNVGDPALEIVEKGDTAVHYRRCMTESEEASLPRKPIYPEGLTAGRSRR